MSKEIEILRKNEIALKNKHLKTFLDKGEVKQFEIAAENIIWFALIFIGAVFLLHILRVVFIEIPTKIIIGFMTVIFSLIISVVISRMHSRN